MTRKDYKLLIDWLSCLPNEGIKREELAEDLAYFFERKEKNFNHCTFMKECEKKEVIHYELQP